MNLDDISTQLLYTTVPIWTETSDNQAGVGTAFIYTIPITNSSGQGIPLLVTAAHTIKNARRALIEFSGRSGDLPSAEGRIHVEIDCEAFRLGISEELDVAAMPLGPVLNHLESQGRLVFFRSITREITPNEEMIADLAALEDVVFIGYPAGLRDQKNALPIIRRGITATPVWNNFQGSPQFLIDAGVFPGSSGSPVFILNQGSYSTRNGVTIGSRILFLGMISETLLRESENNADNNNTYLGIGVVLRSVELSKFLTKIADNLVRQEKK